MKLQSGAARIVDALQRSGVRCVFGLPGTQTLELFEALRQRKLRIVVGTNELAAAFMAGGWARATGEPGVLVTISGPGFTWAMTGVAEARLDSIPLVHLVISPPLDPTPRFFRQQELPQTEIARPLYKAIVDADKYADLGNSVFEAIKLAESGEPGPVLVQISSSALALQRNLEAVTPESRAHSESIVGYEGVCTRLHRARRPVLLAGRGTVHHAPALRRLVERMNLPVITTPSARGVIAENHPLNFRFDPFAAKVSDINELLKSADLVVAVGCKLGHSDTSGFELELPAERLIHLYSSTEVVGANYPASLGVVGDVSELLERLLDSDFQRTGWTEEELELWRSRLGAMESVAVEPAIAGTPAGDAKSFFAGLRSALPADTVLVLDSGLHQVLARRYYPVFAPLGLLIPTDLQSMGFAIPTSIGACLALPNRPVVALLGDGGFAMTGLELLTAAREGLPIVVIVFADGAFGQIRLQQMVNYGTTYGVILKNPDFSLLATSVGARYERIGPTDDVEDVVRRSLRTGSLTLIEVGVTDAFPMRRVAATALARQATRRTAGPRFFNFVAKILRKDR